MAETHASGFKLVVYKEIVEGERNRRSRAPPPVCASFDSARPYDVFAPVFEQLFPGKRDETRSRGGARTQVEVLVGQFLYNPSIGPMYFPSIEALAPRRAAND
jgi:hypothetical protein